MVTFKIFNFNPTIFELFSPKKFSLVLSTKTLPQDPKMKIEKKTPPGIYTTNMYVVKCSQI